VRHPLIAGWPYDVRDTVTRRERLVELACNGVRIVPCGTVAALRKLNRPLVVYTDPLAHCGEGKVLLSGTALDTTDQTAFASVFLGDPGAERFKSNRLLFVGDYCFVLTYESGFWQSNVNGEYRLEHAEHVTRGQDLFRHPMYSIDFVHDPVSDEDFAVDLNVCPGVPLDVINRFGREALVQSLQEFVP